MAEPGVGDPGSLPPQVESAGEPQLVHEDRRGRGPHAPLAVAGADGGGFAVAWRDMRDGNRALYLARLDPDGELRGPEQPFAERGSPATELAPTLALNEKGELALAWQVRLAGGTPSFLVRLAQHDGSFRGATTTISVPEGRTELPGRGRGRASSGPGDGELHTALVLDRDGDAHCAWTYDGLIFLQELTVDGELGDLGLVESPGPPAVGAPLLTGSQTGPELCVWNTAEGVWLRRLGRRPTPAHSVGPGRALRAVPLREGGRSLGWWLLVDLGDRIVLRNIAETGERGGPDVPFREAPWGRVDLASWSRGLIVLHQAQGEPGPQGFEGGAVALHFLSADGRTQARPSLELPCGTEETLVQPMIVGAGERALVVWGRSNGRFVDVHRRVLRAEEDGVEEPDAAQALRLNSDVVSADQVRVQVAAAGGDRAVLVWEDHRDGRPRAYARLVTSSGTLAGPEIALARATEPRVAMAPGGEFAALWGAGAGVLRLRTFDPSGEPLGPVRDLAEKVDAERGTRIVRQEGYRAWLAGWVGAEGVFLRRVGRDGTPLLEPRLALQNASAPALAELDDGRVVVVAETGPPGERRLSAVFLTRDLQPQGDPFPLPASWRSSDTAPEVAPGAPELPGSFLVAWTAGADTVGDVLCMLVGPDGRPAARPRAVGTLQGSQHDPSLARLPDGSWAVAWEDDLSGRGHAYVRRIFPSADRLGPARLLNHRRPAHRVSAHTPALAATDAGLLAAWVDAQRGQGFDVWFRPLPPVFEGD